MSLRHAHLPHLYGLPSCVLEALSTFLPRRNILFCTRSLCRKKQIGASPCVNIQRKHRSSLERKLTAYTVALLPPNTIVFRQPLEVGIKTKVCFIVKPNDPTARCSLHVGFHLSRLHGRMPCPLPLWSVSWVDRAWAPGCRHSPAAGSRSLPSLLCACLLFSSELWGPLRSPDHQH